MQTRFGLDEIGKSHVLSSMGCSWRQYKCRISKQIRSIPSGPEATRQLQLLKPDNVVDEEWNKFVKFRLSPEFDVSLLNLTLSTYSIIKAFD